MLVVELTVIAIVTITIWGLVNVFGLENLISVFSQKINIMFYLEVIILEIGQKN